MKLIFRLAALVLFIVFFGFALKNTQEATLDFFLNYEIRAPLVLLLLGFFVLGFVFGILGMLTIVVRQKRELSRNKRTMNEMRKNAEAHSLAVTPIQANGLAG